MASELTDIGPLQPLFERAPLGLFTDIDGTLSPIVPRPEDARISPICRNCLTDLISLGVRVALITGRTMEVAKKMTRLDDVAYAVSHGSEIWIEGRKIESSLPHPPPEVIGAVRKIEHFLADKGVAMEEKGAGVAFHYRRAADEPAARTAILDAIRDSFAAHLFRISEGRKVIELRPQTPADKGTATRHLVDVLGVRALICLGDDQTDIDMFRAGADLRNGGLTAAIVAVRSNETPAGLLEHADYYVDGVPGVEWVLGQLAATLR